ncbi:MAG: trigger factor [Saprospiraceae bacterium]|nr:trigger factor [Saprospiraceae bacterium]
MKISKEVKDDQTALLTLEVSQKDYETKVKQTLKKYAAQAEIKGFRKGKVPAGMIKKMYGNAVLADEIQHLLGHKVNDYIRENELEILGQPLPIVNPDLQIDINQMGDFTFQYELGLSPEVDLKYVDTKPKFQKYKITVDDELVSKEIENMQMRMGEVEHPESKPTGKDAVEVTLKELDDAGNVKEGGYEHKTAFGFDQLKLKKDQTAIGKMKLDSTYAPFNVYKAFDKPKEEIAKAFLELDAEVMETVGTAFELTLNKINRVGAAEINQEYFDKLYGEGKVNSEEEYRAKVKEELENYLDQAADNRLRADIFKKFSEEIDVELPDAFLQKWLKATRDEKVSEADIDKEYDIFAADLKTSLVFGAIAKQGELQVDAEELKGKVRENITQQFQYYGMPLGENEEMLESMVQRFMSDEKQLRQTHDQLMDTKIFEYLKGKVKVSDKEVSLDDFNALNQ